MFTATFILFISTSVCCTVCQYMCSRTYITIIVFIICEFVFSEKAFFGLGTGIRKKWLNSIFQQLMGDCRSFISCICNYHLRIQFRYLIV